MATLAKDITPTRKLTGPILNVFLQYRDGYKQIDMDTVKAISFHKKFEVPVKPADKGGEPDIPGNVVQSVPTIQASDVTTQEIDETRASTGVCYWDGTHWVCGA